MLVKTTSDWLIYLSTSPGSQYNYFLFFLVQAMCSQQPGIHTEKTYFSCYITSSIAHALGKRKKYTQLAFVHMSSYTPLTLKHSKQLGIKGNTEFRNIMRACEIQVWLVEFSNYQPNWLVENNSKLQALMCDV